MNVTERFPKHDKLPQEEITALKDGNPHKTIVNILSALRGMGKLSFANIINTTEAKLHDRSHDWSYAFALLALKLGMKELTLLDCHEIDHHELASGKITKQQPQKKFEHIGYNPYCVVEIIIDGKRLILSPAHFSLQDRLHSSLRPDSHDTHIGILSHCEDNNRSAIYLQPVILPKIEQDLTLTPIWKKHDYKYPETIEYYHTFKRTPLVL